MNAANDSHVCVELRTPQGDVRSLDEFLADAKRQYITTLLALNNKSVVKVAKLAKRNRTALYQIFREVGIPVRRRCEGEWWRPIPSHNNVGRWS